MGPEPPKADLGNCIPQPLDRQILGLFIEESLVVIAIKLLILTIVLERFEDAKGVIRSRKSKMPKG